MITTSSTVVIGRNEGARLKLCLDTLFAQAGKIVYVDSGSTDDSVAYANLLGIEVVQLDMSTPFSAGRARNEGFHHALARWPETEAVQFIDGDCELEKGWLTQAKKHLETNSSWAIVAGRVKERYPENSVYNLLCDIEWDTPLGTIDSCGGIFMIKTQAFINMGGFNTQVIAGEEPELCYRLRQHNWEIHRVSSPMAMHDANISKFSQWWQRCIRSGHAYAQGVKIHGKNIHGYCVKDSLRIWYWSVILPFFILLLTLWLSPFFLFLFSL